MNVLEMLETYPKSAVVVKQWLLDKLLDGLNSDNLPEGFKEYVRQEGITDEKVAGILDGSPRALFDVFDSHKLYIEIEYQPTGFWWRIKNPETVVGLGNNSAIRKDAEREAVERAFELLNNKL